MDFSSKTKDYLEKLADVLELEVETAGKKPTKDELIVALEQAVKDDDEAVTEGIKLLEDDNDEEDDNEDLEGEVYTYVGGGEESPRKIMFMGKQEFVRGRPTIVTDAHMLKKLENHPSFRAGKVSEDEIESMEDNAAELANANRKADNLMNAQFKKQHSGK